MATCMIVTALNVSNRQRIHLQWFWWFCHIISLFLPSSSNLMSFAAWMPSSFRFFSICLLRAREALSSALMAQPMMMACSGVRRASLLETGEPQGGAHHHHSSSLTTTTNGPAPTSRRSGPALDRFEPRWRWCRPGAGGFSSSSDHSGSRRHPTHSHCLSPAAAAALEAAESSSRDRCERQQQRWHRPLLLKGWPPSSPPQPKNQQHTQN